MGTGSGQPHQIEIFRAGQGRCLSPFSRASPSETSTTEGMLPMLDAMECLDVEHAVEPAAIVLDAEFQHLVPGPAPEEQALLEEALHRDGCREPLVVWPCA